MSSFAQVEMKVVQWSEARRIIPNSTPRAQLVKALEELAELMKADLANDMPEIQDGIGDLAVCLVNYCALRDVDFTTCFAGAYETIKHRKGTMNAAGLFVKEAA